MKNTKLTPVQMKKEEDLQSLSKYVRAKIVFLNSFMNINHDSSKNALLRLIAILKKHNPLNSIKDVDYLLDTLKKTTDKVEFNGTVNLISKKITNHFSAKSNIVIEKKSKVSSKLDREKLNELVESEVENKRKYYKLFCASIYIKQTLEKELIVAYNSNLSDEQRKKFLFSIYNNTKSYSPLNTTLYPYGGGKKKYKEQHNSVLSTITDNQTIETYIDPFMGGAGSFYNSFAKLLEIDVKKVVLNDINPRIIHCNKIVKNKPEQLKKEICEISRELTLELIEDKSVETYKEFFKAKLTELNTLESKGIFNAKSVALMLFLMKVGFGGNYTYNEKTKLSKVSFSNTLKKYKSFPNVFLSIDLYHYLYNKLDVQFENKDYKKIINKYDSKSTFILLDPPYVEENKTSLKKFQKDFKNSGLKMEQYIKSCPFNYGFNNFPHIELLECMGNIQGKVMYHNYKHPILEFYSKKYGYEILELEKKSNNGYTKKGSKIDVKIEYLLHSKPTSSTHNKHLQICKDFYKKVA
jgi:site-specific DNA-adenine methylase